MIDWYRLPDKTVQDLILVMAMSNNPMKISAGRIIYLSLATFGNVGFYEKLYLRFAQSKISANGISSVDNQSIHLFRF